MLFIILYGYLKILIYAYDVLIYAHDVNAQFATLKNWLYYFRIIGMLFFNLFFQEVCLFFCDFLEIWIIYQVLAKLHYAISIIIMKSTDY